LAVPHPNVSIVKRCKPFPIEFVVRYVLKWTKWVDFLLVLLDSRVLSSVPIWQVPHPLRYGKTTIMACESTVGILCPRDSQRRPKSLDTNNKGRRAPAEIMPALEVFRFGQELATQRGLILVIQLVLQTWMQREWRCHHRRGQSHCQIFRSYSNMSNARKVILS
jgi:hypothetical protein